MNKILRQFALERRDEPGLNYAAFRQRLRYESFNEAQFALLQTRLQLLESFMIVPSTPGAAFIAENPKMKNEDKASLAEKKKYQAAYEQNKAAMAKGKKNIWDFKEGTLTIVDLSCPFVDESAACALFNICIALFLEERGDVGRIVALDEAHKVRTTIDCSYHLCCDVALLILPCNSSCLIRRQPIRLQKHCLLSFVNNGT